MTEPQEPEPEEHDLVEPLWEDEEEIALSAERLTVETGGARLDAWLAAQLPDRSRSEVQRWIKNGLVTLAGRPLKASYRVETGDEIQALVPEPEEYSVEPEAIPIDVLYEDDDLLAVNKPAGMVVHPGAGNWHGTLVHAVLYHCPALEGVGGAGRPGIVHRLDKDTSGVILVAKNDRAHRALQEQFRDRTVEKTYLALAHGKITPLRGEIRAPIGRDHRHRQRMAVQPPGQGRPAATRFEVDAYYGNHTLVRCYPLTGRTHQIRVHLAYLHHPVVCDTLYGGRRAGTGKCLRHFLHALRIRFRLPSTGEVKEIEAPLPEDFGAVLERLGGGG